MQLTARLHAQDAELKADAAILTRVSTSNLPEAIMYLDSVGRTTSLFIASTKIREIGNVVMPNRQIDHPSHIITGPPPRL